LAENFTVLSSELHEPVLKPARWKAAAAATTRLFSILLKNFFELLSTLQVSQTMFSAKPKTSCNANSAVDGRIIVRRQQSCSIGSIQYARRIASII
jgi:hypothetical protein